MTNKNLQEQKSFEQFLTDLRIRQSANDYTSDNSNLGLIGAYQFSEFDLAQAGYYNAGETGLAGSQGSSKKVSNWDGSWSGKDNVFSKADYLNSKIAQDNAATEILSDDWKLILGEGLDAFVGRQVKNVAIDSSNKGDLEVTESGLIWAAHLRGLKPVRDFLYSQGSDNQIDEKSVPIAQEIIAGQNYNLPADKFLSFARSQSWFPAKYSGGNGYDSLCYFSFGRDNELIDSEQYSYYNQKIKNQIESISRNPYTSQDTSFNWQDGVNKVAIKDGSGHVYFACDNSQYYHPIDQKAFLQISNSVADLQLKSPTFSPAFAPSKSESDIDNLGYGAIAGIVVASLITTYFSLKCFLKMCDEDANRDHEDFPKESRPKRSKYKVASQDLENAQTQEYFDQENMSDISDISDVSQKFEKNTKTRESRNHPRSIKPKRIEISKEFISEDDLDIEFVEVYQNQPSSVVILRDEPAQIVKRDLSTSQKL